MKAPVIAVFACSLAVLGLGGMASQPASPKEKAPSASGAPKPANTSCPIYKAPIDPQVPVLVVEGTAIGFKTVGASREFNTWKPARKQAYAKRIRAGAEWSDPYVLGTCPIAGESLAEAESPVVHFHKGRQFNFCCAGCVGAFEENPQKYIDQIDAEIIKTQARYYPLKTCLVSGEDLSEGAVDFVYGNRHVRLCCGGCLAELQARPEKYLPTLNKAIVEAQRKDYPLTHCLVMPDDPIDEDGHAHEVVVGNRLLMLCCEGCETALRDSPAKYIEKLDRAR